MARLDDATRKEIGDRLFYEVADIEEKIIDLEEATKPIVPDKAIGRLSRLESMNEKSVNDASLYRARERLSKLEKARMNVHDPSFGICVGCSQPIPVERLLLLPESTRCVACAEKS
ncbi:MAG: DnaK suppressor protein [Verrucomicrobiales bacterium]|jgi:DnaK suppressor protein